VRKKPISQKDAIKLARKARRVYGVSGQKIVSYDLSKDKPSDEELAKLVIGRSGTLRAPCLQVDDDFVGGFNPDLYKKLLKLK
jgi:arsenate reductase-like glutaredoxin family protein